MFTAPKELDASLDRHELESDLLKIKDGFFVLLEHAVLSMSHHKSSHLHGLKHFEEVYLRVRTGNCNLLGYSVLVISSISIFHRGKGIFSALLSELKTLTASEGYMLQIENVLTPHFRNFLIRQGFIFPGDSWMCGSGYWVYDTEILLNHTQDLPV